VGRTESSNILTDNCKLLTQKLVGAKNIDFAPKFPQNARFSATNQAVLKEKIPTEKNFPNRLYE